VAGIIALVSGLGLWYGRHELERRRLLKLKHKVVTIHEYVLRKQWNTASQELETALRHYPANVDLIGLRRTIEEGLFASSVRERLAAGDFSGAQGVHWLLLNAPTEISESPLWRDLYVEVLHARFPRNLDKSNYVPEAVAVQRGSVEEDLVHRLEAE